MTNSSNKQALSVVLTVLVFAALTLVVRLNPHVANLAPAGAIALFIGAQLSRFRGAFLLPLAIIFLSDVALAAVKGTAYGFYPDMPFTYLAYALIFLVGRSFRNKVNAGTVLAGSVASSVAFFLVSNFGVWAMTNMYPKTAAGLAACYTAGLEYFRPTLTGDLLYAPVLFGAFYLATRSIARQAAQKA